MHAKVMATCLVGLMVSLNVAPAARADKGTEQNEKKIQITDLPMAVRKTLKREANGFAIKSVDVEKVDGKTVYETDVIIDGINYEILVSKSGQLISKKIDNEEDEADSTSAKSKVKKAASKKSDDDEDKPSSKNTKTGKSAKADEDEDDDKPKAAKAKSGKVTKVQKEDEEDDEKAGKSKTKPGKSGKVEGEQEDDDKPATPKSKSAKPDKVQKESKDDSESLN